MVLSFGSIYAWGFWECFALLSSWGLTVMWYECYTACTCSLGVAQFHYPCVCPSRLFDNGVPLKLFCLGGYTISDYTLQCVTVQGAAHWGSCPYCTCTHHIGHPWHPKDVHCHTVKLTQDINYAERPLFISWVWSMFKLNRVFTL